MAFKLRTWLGALVFGMAFLTIRLFPITPRDTPASGARPLHPAKERFRAVDAEVIFQRTVLDRLFWLDSLTDRLRVPDGGGPAVAVGVTPGFSADAQDRFESLVRSEASRQTPRSSSMDLGVFVRVGSYRDGYKGDEYYAGERRGRPYCLVLRLLTGTNDLGLLPPEQATTSERLRTGFTPRPSGVLGPCAFFLRYGVPGPQVAAWLSGGALSRAARTEVPEGYIRGLRVFRTLGRFTYPQNEVSPRGNRCLEGSSRACLAVFTSGGSRTRLEERLRARLPELWGKEPELGRGVDFRLADPVLFTDLEREFGRERFARFWTSSQDPATAFQEAFDVGAAEWVGRWARSYYGEARGTLQAGPGDWVTSLLVVLAALGIAAFTARRRQVG